MSKGLRMSRYPHDAKVYVGDLGSNASKQEIEDAFGYYGPLRSVWVARNPPGFAFVEFEDARDAEDSVRGLDGRTICGRRARVELSTGKSARRGGDSGSRSSGGGYRESRSDRDRGRSDRNRGGGGGFNPDDRCYECGDRGHYARDCNRTSRRGRRRSRSRSRSREYRTRSRSYSRSRSKHSRSKTPRGEREEHSNSRGDSKSPRRSVTKSKSRSRTPKSRSTSRHHENGHDMDD
uniref:Putative catalytic step 2 spliceosome n=1 Tax=Corethrella appendiculata TaxID=1370023 RepID=U5EUP1_9DIPT